MEFRLLYQGPLLPSGNRNTRPAQKHAIRSSLHPQLRRQWQMHAGLRQLAASVAYPGSALRADDERVTAGTTCIGKKWALFGHEFVPMVTSEHFVRCSLDILLLRPEEKKFIFEQGDIDGQVKTIFDALQIPKSLEQAGGKGPQDDETPFFCLLEDDRLISEVRVNADQLLLLPHEREIKANDAFVVIHVKINARYPGAVGNVLA